MLNGPVQQADCARHHARLGGAKLPAHLARAVLMMAIVLARRPGRAAETVPI
jgi:hypothetical protein